MLQTETVFSVLHVVFWPLAASGFISPLRSFNGVCLGIKLSFQSRAAPLRALAEQKQPHLEYLPDHGCGPGHARSAPRVFVRTNPKPSVQDVPHKHSNTALRVFESRGGGQVWLRHTFPLVCGRRACRHTHTHTSSSVDQLVAQASVPEEPASEGGTLQPEQEVQETHFLLDLIPSTSFLFSGIWNKIQTQRKFRSALETLWLLVTGFDLRLSSAPGNGQKHQSSRIRTDPSPESFRDENNKSHSQEEGLPVGGNPDNFLLI